jgi:hypothetical protein
LAAIRTIIPSNHSLVSKQRMRIRLVVVGLCTASVAVVLWFWPVAESRRRDTLVDAGPQVVKATAFAISPSVASIAVEAFKARPKDGQNIPLRQVNEEDEESEPAGATGIHDSDGALSVFSTAPMPAPSLSFDGLSNYNNIDLYNALIIPPDPIGDVGPAHYVQAVNAAIRIYDKNGTAQTPPFKLGNLFAPLGTPCSTRNDGDPSVVYDPLADRWVLSQYCTAFPPFRQMIAVSKTGDPTGQYFVYEFVMPNIRLNDYAKLNVWPDGYYMSTDEFFGSDYVGSGAFAFDRRRMLAGDSAASYIYFNLPIPPGERRGGLLASDLDGLNPPPTGSPNYYVGYTANEYGDASDAVRLYEFHADFEHPENSTFREMSNSPLTVAAFDPTSPAGRADIEQPPPGERLDSVSDRMMYRIAYRNFGDHESMVFNQTVRMTPLVEPYRSGVRVYELRRSVASPFTVAEQSTIGDSGASRWLGAAAQDNAGNLAVAYSLASDSKRPSVVYSGRLSTDPPGTMRTESTLMSGTGVQKAFGYRWGDYSGMTVDPEDDCTFWVTNEYFTLESETFSDFAWLTRIGKFKFAECTPMARSTITGSITDASSGHPINGAIVAAGSYSRMSDASGSYGNLIVIPGDYTLSVSARGYRTQTAVVSATTGQTISRNFALEPIPIVENTALSITSESCSINHAAEPGESVTVALALRNSGLLPANDLTVALERIGGVINTGPSQNYGTLPADGSIVTRQFTFTLSPTIACGSEVSLRFTLIANGQAIGTLPVPIRAGEVRYALSEHFDVTANSRLPAGWSTSATGGQQPWATSSARSSSPTRSVFSPDPIHVGVNEVISPSIQITSPQARLTFRNWYELETTFLRNRLYDGSVLELSTDGGPWQDIITAGGSFDSGGYDGIIDSCCQNPLAGRLGWSGRSGINQTSEFITSSVRLPASAAGHSIRFRWRVGTDIGTFREGQYIDDVTVTDGYSCSCSSAAGGRAIFDFDGDGRTDLSVFRPNDVPNAPDFVVQNSTNGSIVQTTWGSSGDVAASADFDGDRRTDYAVFRPSTGVWYILRSSDSSILAASFGLAGDRPMPSDHDGDGKADIGVFRPADGTWYSINSSNGQISIRQFGIAEDKPVASDYDGDGHSDIAVFRPSTGVWYIARSSDGGYTIVPFGQLGDKPVPGDFDGDGQTDIAVFRRSTGVWYLLRSKLGFGAAQFGLATDAPLQADFDGDGQNDIAVFRPETAVWYYIRSSDGTTVSIVFGSAGDEAVPAIFTSN